MVDIDKVVKMATDVAAIALGEGHVVYGATINGLLAALEQLKEQTGWERDPDGSDHCRHCGRERT